jgi:hypothetical protein
MDLHSQIALAPPQALTQALRPSIFPLENNELARDSGGAIASTRQSLTENPVPRAGNKPNRVG